MAYVFTLHPAHAPWLYTFYSTGHVNTRSNSSMIHRNFEEEDEYCPGCDNKFIVDAKTPQMGIGVEGHDARMGKR